MVDTERTVRGYLGAEISTVTHEPTEPREPAGKTARPARVMVGIDGSEGSIEAVRWAAREADRRGAALRLVHVCLLPGFSGQSTPDTSIEGSTARWLRKAEAAAKAVVPSLDVCTEVRQGEASTVLRAVAEQSGLVVVGSRGLGAVGRLMIGSVATELATRSPVPVVLARPVSHPNATTSPRNANNSFPK